MQTKQGFYQQPQVVYTQPVTKNRNAGGQVGLNFGDLGQQEHNLANRRALPQDGGGVPSRRHRQQYTDQRQALRGSEVSNFAQLSEARAQVEYHNQVQYVQRQKDESDESILSERMRNLADKAYKLSLKYDLSDEVQLIQIEEQKLAQYLKEVEDTKTNSNQETNKSSPTAEFNKDKQRRSSGYTKSTKRMKGGEQSVSQKEQSNVGRDFNSEYDLLRSNEDDQYFNEDNERTRATAVDQDEPSQDAKLSKRKNRRRSKRDDAQEFGAQSQINPNSTQGALSMSSEMDIDKTVSRLFNDATVRQQRLELMKTEGERQKNEENKEKPSINKKSAKLSKNQGQAPIYERFQKLIARKEKKRLELKQQMEDEARKKDPDAFNPSFKPMIDPVSRNKAIQNEHKFQTSSASATMYDKDMIWANKINEKTKAMKKLKQAQEVSECTFQPRLIQTKADFDDKQSNRSLTPARLNQNQLNEFLTRNITEYVDFKEKRKKAMDEHFYRDVRQKPTITNKSRKIARSISVNNADKFNMRPWTATNTQKSSMLFTGTLNQSQNRSSYTNTLLASTKSKPDPLPQTDLIIQPQLSLNQHIFNCLAEKVQTSVLDLPQPTKAHDNAKEAFNMTLLSESIGVSPFLQQKDVQTSSSGGSATATARPRQTKDKLSVLSALNQKAKQSNDSSLKNTLSSSGKKKIAQYRMENDPPSVKDLNSHRDNLNGNDQTFNFDNPRRIKAFPDFNF